jgi:uncharacterized delta-60 repeat protein
MRAPFTSTVILLWIGFLAVGAAHADLQLDPSFGTGGFVRTSFGTNLKDTPNDMLFLPDGRILVGGRSEGPGVEYYVALALYSANGVLDGTFGSGGNVLFRDDYRDYANAIALQPDGKIVAVGARWNSNFGSAEIPSIYRFEANGSIDGEFGTNGATVLRYDAVSSGEHAGVVVRADGRLHAAGRSSANASGGHSGFGVKRYLTTGAQESQQVLDRNILFNTGACAFPPDGGVLWANYEWVGRTDYVLARVDSLGNPDPSFGPSGIRATGIEASEHRSMQLHLLPSGKFLLGGTTPHPTLITRMSVFRFNADGTLDTSFGADGRVDIDASPVFGDVCEDIAVDPEGRIVLAGLGVSGLAQGALVRLLEDGTPDESFGPGGIFLSTFQPNAVFFTRVIPLPGGVILVAGIDQSSQGGDFLLARYKPSPTAVRETATAPFHTGRVFPNPSATTSRLELQLPAQDFVRASIVDVAGRRVRDLFAGSLPAGTHLLEWDGRDDLGRMAASGTYLVRWETPRGALVRKVLRVR